jgi:peroxiredoxin
VIAQNGRIVYAYTDPDYRDRADPEEVLRSLKEATVAAA